MCVFLDLCSPCSLLRSTDRDSERLRELQDTETIDQEDEEEVGEEDMEDDDQLQ